MCNAVKVAEYPARSHDVEGIMKTVISGELPLTSS